MPPDETSLVSSGYATSKTDTTPDSDGPTGPTDLAIRLTFYIRRVVDLDQSAKVPAPRPALESVRREFDREMDLLYRSADEARPEFPGTHS